MNEKSWKQIFKQLICYYFFIGHKLRDHGPHKECVRCGEKFFNAQTVFHKHKRLRHNKWGKKYF